ncbi:hypothetical protein AVEN_114512-1 [Araneus ventricosus]|uniref:Uncharacterized protein n=1 Tax=Araneus ventricosus TaxID=182803 RepID=A0A4Y2PAT4_ARAVE|nr:hypothetical protein AVEN_114512-1 [Araneus ventricosus]
MLGQGRDTVKKTMEEGGPSRKKVEGRPAGRLLEGGAGKKKTKEEGGARRKTRKERGELGKDWEKRGRRRARLRRRRQATG